MAFQEYYRAYDERYRKVYSLGARTWRRPEVDEQLERFLQTSKLPAGEAIDLGCGEGIDAIWLAGQGWRVVAVDLSTTAIHRARELAAEAGASVDFRVSDVLDLSDLEDASFDLAVNIFSLHMFVEAEHRLRHLQAAHRLLRPGGWLFLDNLGRGRGKEGRALPAGQPVEFELAIGDRTVRVTLPAVPAVRLSDHDLRAELGAAEFLIRRLYRVGHSDYRRIICWAQKPEA